jgi:hypothetical protein
MNHKKIGTIFATITMLTALLLPIVFIQTALAADPASWYMTKNGVLDTDTYTLYPYEADSIKLGLSKFGELIDSETNIGLEYANARDPFAAPAGASLDNSKLPKNVWINGWYISLTYNHASWGTRNVWAGALFADLTAYGGPWIKVDNGYWNPVGYEYEEDFRDPGLAVDANGDVVGTTLEWGGRKTNGTATTEDIQVLYDGPREFVAMVVNHIYDYHEPTQSKLHLVDVMFTIIFNKVKKEVIVLKDVKMMDQAKYVLSPLNLDIPESSSVELPRSILVQFSNREEWDLGVAPNYESYIHFYTDYNSESNSTCYNEDWTMLPTLPAGYSVDTTPLALHGSQPATDGTYDVAQIISNDLEYVAWAAYWPSLSDWSADAGSGRANLWWRAMTANDPHDTDSFVTPEDEPFLAPLTIGEWDFVLSDEAKSVGAVSAAPQFRGVTVYGITDRNDGDDEDRTGGTNIIDKEATYQMEEVYNPWDLYDTVYKNTSRWVKFYPYGTSSPIDLEPDPVQTEWDAYCTFAERVVLYPAGTLWTRGVEYSLTSSGITLNTPIPAGCTLKVLWSSDEWNETFDETSFGPGRYEWLTVGRDAHSVDSAGSSLVTAAFKQKNITMGISGMDMMGLTSAQEIPYAMFKFGAGNTFQDYFIPSDPTSPGQRLTLSDDWCTYWPVASSNMISVGGPLANWVSMYFNDFTSGLYGAPWFTPYVSWKEKIVALTCWNKTDAANSYINSGGATGTGYATIGTYKDINGTVGLVIYGLDARDTYYATQWLHGDAARGINPGIIQLQSAPRGLTSIIIKIDYTDQEHPTFSIPELLGTITETAWTHQYTNIYTGQGVVEEKGGIHDP